MCVLRVGGMTSCLTEMLPTGHPLKQTVNAVGDSHHVSARHMLHIGAMDIHNEAIATSVNFCESSAHPNARLHKPTKTLSQTILMPTQLSQDLAISFGVLVKGGR